MMRKVHTVAACLVVLERILAGRHPSATGMSAYAEVMHPEFAHEPDARRYAMHLGRQLVCILDYRINNNAISLIRTYTQPAQRGNGYAGQLVEYAVNDIEATTTYRIVPMCWYVAEWFEAHPDRTGALER